MLPVISHREFIAKEITQQPSLLGNSLVVPNGRIIVYGPPGVYKTYAVQQLVYAMAEGQDWMGYKMHGARPTLLVELEMTEAPFQQRSIAIGSAGSTCYYSQVYDYTLDSEKAYRDLLEAAQYTKAEFVMVDPLNLIMSGSENSDQDTRFILKLLNRLRGDTGACVGFIHHSNKGLWHDGQKVDRGAGDISGNKNLWAWADTIVRLIPTDSKDTIELRWEKVRNAEEPPSVWLRFDNVTNVLGVSDADPKLSVMRALEDGPIGITEIDKMIMGILGRKAGAARELRKQLVKLGWVEEVRDPLNAKRKLLRAK